MEKFPRFPVKNTETTIRCEDCKGKGYYSVQGFDGNERVDCTECDCRGGWEFTPVSIDEIEAEVAAVAATIADVEVHMGVAVSAPKATPMPMPVHSNMSADFFDRSVKRAFDAGLSISRTDRASVVAVSSGTDEDVYYDVTATSCTCQGHARVGRCYHRALAIWHWWVQECDAVAIAAHQSAPVEILEPVAA